MQEPEAYQGNPINLTFENQTIRQIVKISVGGKKVRVRLSNTYGSMPLQISAAHIAISDGDDRIVPETDRVLTFGGNESIKIPVGADILSDPVSLKVPNLAKLGISIYLTENSGASTWHIEADQTAYVSIPGDYTSNTHIPTEQITEAGYFLSGIEVLAPGNSKVIVAFGDSITDGTGSSLNANNRWPDFLAARLISEKKKEKYAVLNAGIAGNRILNNSPYFGENALARFNDNVITQSGITHLIFFMGINDIGFGQIIPTQVVSAEEMIAGMKQIILKAHAKGIRVIGCTLTPFEGFFFYTPEGEEKRQQINHWIRTCTLFDGVIDFDSVVADPENPAQLHPDYNYDNIHLNDAGYKAMADAIDLSLFKSIDKKN
ncbi:MAG: SGNH/GDSL hydrolase family protein [Spirochaetes bacterium]|nr:SGNH/GDSL hydrolase family protein [Spirochaetota bacterium]